MSNSHHGFQSFILSVLVLGTWCAGSSTAGYSGGLDTTLKVANTGTGKAIVGTAAGSSATAVIGRGTGGYSTGVLGSGGGAGVRGESSSGAGVDGFSINGNGTQGSSTYGSGMWASSDYGSGLSAYGATYGVNANSNDGYGVAGTGYVGVIGSSWSSGGLGVGAYVSAEEGTNKGLEAIAGGGNLAYGLVAEASGAGQNWAAHFNGNVHVQGTLSWTSDARFKKNIRPLENGLAKVMALEPKAYDMRVEEYKGRMHLAEGGQYGLIADEVEAVLPDLVLPVTAPVSSSNASKDPARRGGGETISYKSVNYTALIPILVEAVQEQQKLILAQQARIEALEAKAGR